MIFWNSPMPKRLMVKGTKVGNGQVGAEGRQRRKERPHGRKRAHQPRPGEGHRPAPRAKPPTTRMALARMLRLECGLEPETVQTAQHFEGRRQDTGEIDALLRATRSLAHPHADDDQGDGRQTQGHSQSGRNRHADAQPAVGPTAPPRPKQIGHTRGPFPHGGCWERGRPYPHARRAHLRESGSSGRGGPHSQQPPRFNRQSPFDNRQSASFRR